jgi:hypothetical protein
VEYSAQAGTKGFVSLRAFKASYIACSPKTRAEFKIYLLISVQWYIVKHVMHMQRLRCNSVAGYFTLRVIKVIRGLL